MQTAQSWKILSWVCTALESGLCVRAHSRIRINPAVPVATCPVFTPHALLLWHIKKSDRLTKFGRRGSTIVKLAPMHWTSRFGSLFDQLQLHILPVVSYPTCANRISRMLFVRQILVVESSFCQRRLETLNWKADWNVSHLFETCKAVWEPRKRRKKCN